MACPARDLDRSGLLRTIPARYTCQKAAETKHCLVARGASDVRAHPGGLDQGRVFTVRFTSIVSAATLAIALAPLPVSAQQACTHTVGVVVELTGPAGRFGQAAAKSIELAFKEINEAGGAAGCQLAADLRDSQSQGSVAVDQARQLVDLKRVPAIIGGTVPAAFELKRDSVTAPANVVQISPASSSPTLTRTAQEGKTNGIFFRTITSDALQGTAAAKYAMDQGLKKIAVIHVNNDFGENMVAEFKRAYEALGALLERER